MGYLATTGSLLSACDAPDCTEEYDVITGPSEQTPDRHWLRSPTLGLHMCPDHAWLWEQHRPRLDHQARTAACSCGELLPAPTLGHIRRAWIAHANAL